MQCPTDGSVLTMSERSGIEIDYCPTCRGVWLDRGELDKILDRSLAQQAPPQSAPQAAPQSAPPAASQHGYPQQGYQQPGYQQQGHYKKKRKESWLSEIFD